jgi:hypothetical protein
MSYKKLDTIEYNRYEGGHTPTLESLRLVLGEGGHALTGTPSEDVIIPCVLFFIFLNLDKLGNPNISVHTL